MYEKHIERDTAILLVDASQAIDRIERSYLFEVLQRFGLGGIFKKWIHLQYTNPTVEILPAYPKLDHLETPQFTFVPTRQGCALSPQLFILAIEPLTMAVRAHMGVSGIVIGGSIIVFPYSLTI